mgnify:CR=1 FL=1
MFECTITLSNHPKTHMSYQRLNIHKKTITFTFLFVSVSLLALSMSTIAYAYPSTSALNGGHPSMSQYCKRFQQIKNQRLSRTSWEYGYNKNIGPTYGTSSAAANTRCDLTHGGRYNPLNQPQQLKACKVGYLQKGTENSGSGDNGSGGSDGSSGGGGSSDSSSGGGGSSTSAADTGSDSVGEDGINVSGADIVAGEVSLSDAERAKIRLEKKTGENILVGVLNVAYSIAAVIAVIVIVAAGIMYVTSDGDSNKINTAKNAIIYSSVGLVIIGSAFIITGIIQNIGQAT